MSIDRHCERSEAIQPSHGNILSGLLHRLCLLAMTGLLAITLTACGNKGKLKSPTQMEEAAAKKRARMERQESDEPDAEDILPVDAIKPPPEEPKKPLYGVPATPFDTEDKK